MSLNAVLKSHDKCSCNLLNDILEIIYPSTYGGAIGGYAHMVKRIESLLEASGFVAPNNSLIQFDES